MREPRIEWLSNLIRTIALAALGSVAAAQTRTLGLVPLTSFPVIGGRVIAVDVADDGQRVVTIGEFGDAVIWNLSGRVLARGTVPLDLRPTYVVLHPTRQDIVLCIDRTRRGAPDAYDLLLCTGTRAGDVAGAPFTLHCAATLRRAGSVLGLAWNPEGALLAVGAVAPGGSRVEVFAPNPTGLRSLETVAVGSLLDVQGNPRVVPAALQPFHGRWRCQRYELLPEARGQDTPDDEPWDALLVADAQPLFARHVGGVGVGVDRIGQTFTLRGNDKEVRAFNAGPTLALAFTPDGNHVAAASRAAVTIVACDGKRQRLVHGKHLMLPGSDGSRLVLLGAKVRHYDAALDTWTDGGVLPVCNTGTGEDDATVYDMPQLRSALRLPNGEFVMGGYSRNGHDALVVDLAAGEARVVADTDRVGGRGDQTWTRVNVHELAWLAGSRWIARESVRNLRGDFRSTTVLRAFDRGRALWSRDVQSRLTASAGSRNGKTIAACDERGALSLLDAGNGRPVREAQLARAAQWLGFASDDVLFAHDDRHLIEFDGATLVERARVALPTTARVGSVALSPDGTRIALGYDGHAAVYRVVR